MTDFRALLRALADRGVEFILIGGVAATVHGSSRLTQDLDIVYRRSAENLDRLVQALRDHRPYLKGCRSGSALSVGICDASKRTQFHVDH